MALYLIFGIRLILGSLEKFVALKSVALLGSKMHSVLQRCTQSSVSRPALLLFQSAATNRRLVPCKAATGSSPFHRAI